MLDAPQIVQTTAQIAAVIHITIPRDQIQEVMGPAIMETITVAKEQGIGPVGPVFAHHFDMKPGIFNFEVGVPVSAPVKPVGRVFASELPAAKVVHTVYTGPYEGLDDAWGRFVEEIKASGHQPVGDLWECYVTGPESTPDSATWRTELNHPIH